tara:strand:+ start:180 stop:398 length:219 start_codon:yes stop_codon:yes gene_type:complete
MASLVLKSLPDELHAQLKQSATANRRSMAQEAISLLERGLGTPPPQPLPKPHRGKRPLTDAFLNQAKFKGRT